MLFRSSNPEQMQQMVATFGELGVVEMREGIENDPDFPPRMGVESLGHRAKSRLAAAPKPSEPSTQREPREPLPLPVHHPRR